MVQLTDTLDASNGVRICRDGSLVAEVFAARTGLQDYLGREADPDNKHGFRDRARVSVYRPEAEVFKADSLASYVAAPVTIDHPSVAVTADNWREYGRGEIHGDVVRDGQKVRVPIIVRDAQAVKSATTTHKQISMGYATELVFPADGKHPDGTVCDAYQTDIRINHIAFVPAARGGPELRVIDERPNLPPPSENPMKIRIGDAEVDATNGEAVRIANDAREAQFKDAVARANTAETALATAQTAHDKAMAAKDTEIDALKAQVVDEATIDARAAEKADIVAKAKAILGDKAPDFAGKSVADVRRETVRISKGDAAIADKSADYIEARFDGLVDAKPADPLRQVISGGVQIFGDAEAAFADAQRKASEERRNAWKTPATSAAA